MDAASILLVLAAAGQAGWAPERSASPPPTSASNDDRYAQTPSTPASGVAPPPGVVDRTRTAVTESGAALRDGVEAGIEAANQQLQGWTDRAGRQFQATGNQLRAAAEQSLGVSANSPPPTSNPFGAPPPLATPNSRTRTGVAPPPWADSATSAPNWDEESAEPGPVFGRTGSSALERVPSDSGWTSIGSTVAAPPLLVPPLTSSSSTTAARDVAVSGPSSNTASSLQREPAGRLSGESTRPPAASTAGADNWATGWSDSASAPPATISRTSDTSTRDAAIGKAPDPNQPANARPRDSQQQTGSDWAELWSGQDEWGEPQKAPSSAAPAARVAAETSPPPPDNSVRQPLVEPQTNNVTTMSTAPGVLPPATSADGSSNTSSPVAATDEPPWLPLLVVSLSLAGSLGANFFLGWSYLDARQKYRALVRQTADQFRRAAA